MFDGDKVWRFDTTAGNVRAIVDVDQAPWGVVTGAGSVWVSNHCAGTVSRIDPQTDEIIATVETGLFPQYLEFGNGYLWATVAGEVGAFAECE